MKLFQKLSDNRQVGSLANRLRRKRFRHFVALLSQLERPISILDIGGTRNFWAQMGFADQAGVAITLLNTAPEQFIAPAGAHRGGTQFREVLGDGCSMPQFADKQFDVVFSNSVLEHVGDSARQQQMIDETLRVGRYFFLQTPNYFFPVEPHFHVFGFQFLPRRLRCRLVQWWDLGWSGRAPNANAAAAIVDSVQLLSARTLRRLCPHGELYRERFLGLTKSLMISGRCP